MFLGLGGSMMRMMCAGSYLGLVAQGSHSTGLQRVHRFSRGSTSLTKSQQPRFGNAPLLSTYHEILSPVVTPVKQLTLTGLKAMAGSWGQKALHTIQQGRHWYRDRIPKPVHWLVTTAEALIVTHAAVIAENLYYDNILKPLIVRPSVKQVNHFMTSAYLNPATYAPTSLKAKPIPDSSQSSPQDTPKQNVAPVAPSSLSSSSATSPIHPDFADTPSQNPFLPRNALYLITRSLPNPWLYSGYELEA